MIYRLVIFLALNFSALAIGGLFTSSGVPSDWYVGIAKAPWTPPGWVFGTAWFTIMICFGVYMAYLWPVIENKNILIGLYAQQIDSIGAGLHTATLLFGIVRIYIGNDKALAS
jgi:benzodiazapine receptor